MTALAENRRIHVYIPLIRLSHGVWGDLPKASYYYIHHIPSQFPISHLADSMHKNQFMFFARKLSSRFRRENHPTEKLGDQAGLSNPRASTVEIRTISHEIRAPCHRAVENAMHVAHWFVT